MNGVTLGAVGAALIAAIVSLVGLILSKEQKTSEFRQEWINKLRDEISNYVSHVSAIADQTKIDFQDKNEKLKYLSPFYSSINLCSNTIRLRLNPDEIESQEILRIMAKLESASSDDDLLASSDIQTIEDELIGAAQKLLKKEWKRVKSGEKTFVVAKWSALVFSILLIIVFSVAIFQNLNGGEPDSEPRAAMINNKTRGGSKILPSKNEKSLVSPMPLTSASASPEK